MIKKIVLTGGPCSGKTSIINELKKHGYEVIEEIARSVKSRSAPDKTIEEVQEKILKKQLKAESRIKSSIVFLDRSIVDGIAYYKLNEKNPPNKLITAVKNNRYDAVFFLQMLPNYEKDRTRDEDFKKARKINELIRKSYEETGYKIINIPPASIEQRIAFIKKQLTL
jgi:predicted ATPase